MNTILDLAIAVPAVCVLSALAMMQFLPRLHERLVTVFLVAAVTQALLLVAAAGQGRSGLSLLFPAAGTVGYAAAAMNQRAKGRAG